MTCKTYFIWQNYIYLKKKNLNLTCKNIKLNKMSCKIYLLAKLYLFDKFL